MFLFTATGSGAGGERLWRGERYRPAQAQLAGAGSASRRRLSRPAQAQLAASTTVGVSFGVTVPPPETTRAVKTTVSANLVESAAKGTL